VSLTGNLIRKGKIPVPRCKEENIYAVGKFQKKKEEEEILLWIEKAFESWQQ